MNLSSLIVIQLSSPIFHANLISMDKGLKEIKLNKLLLIVSGVSHNYMPPTNFLNLLLPNSTIIMITLMFGTIPSPTYQNNLYRHS
jgi:hypothetical protein